MWWPGKVRATALRGEILRRERVRRIKETVECYNGTRMTAKYVAAWLYNQEEVEYDAEHYEEGDWYHEKYRTICYIEEDYGDATSDLCRRFQRDLLREVRYPPRS